MILVEIICGSSEPDKRKFRFVLDFIRRRNYERSIELLRRCLDCWSFSLNDLYNVDDRPITKHSFLRVCEYEHCVEKEMREIYIFLLNNGLYLSRRINLSMTEKEEKNYMNQFCEGVIKRAEEVRCFFF